jgi:hypothetical protein
MSDGDGFEKSNWESGVESAKVLKAKPSELKERLNFRNPVLFPSSVDFLFEKPC